MEKIPRNLQKKKNLLELISEFKVTGYKHIKIKSISKKWTCGHHKNKTPLYNYSKKNEILKCKSNTCSGPHV